MRYSSRLKIDLLCVVQISVCAYIDNPFRQEGTMEARLLRCLGQNKRSGSSGSNSKQKRAVAVAAAVAMAVTVAVEVSVAGAKT